MLSPEDRARLPPPVRVPEERRASPWPRIGLTAIALHRLYWNPSGISAAIDRATG